MNKCSHRLSWCRWGVVGLYLLLCVLYFSPIAAPYKLTYPLSLLTLVSLLGGKFPLLTAALAFSAVGDFCGDSGYLLLQIAAFGVAQICYLTLIRRQIQKPSPKRAILAAIAPVTLCVVTFVGIVPAVEEGVVKVGVVVYALLIGLMTTLAFASKSWTVGLGALLFMLSDFILAILIFLTPVPHLSLVSLALYFAGQILLWLGLQRVSMDD